MHPRWAALAAISVLIMGATNDCHNGGGGQHEPHAAAKPKGPTGITVPEPRPHIPTGQCGIGHALRLVPLDDCTPPLTYTLTADARGITMTHVVWLISLRRMDPDGGQGLTGHIVVVRQRPTRVPAYIEITATDASVIVGSHNQYGTGCSIQVTDSLGKQVGLFDSETRREYKGERFPFGHAKCIWA